jgi:dolichyl-diphosphooligosaccharide--protein glycosyltransferase/undecaprenyl-diphosphooligosaccharide--protein glycosyltransferase
VYWKNKIEHNSVILGLFIVIAYLFSMGIRMYWPMHFSGNMSMYDAGQLMINTNDGYCYATGARDMLNGITQIGNPRALVYSTSPGLVLLTGYLVKVTPFSLETIILYLPALISSLIVIPVILVGRLLGHTFLGFLAALLASITWSYYNRTMVGYYDTDMFSIFLQFSIFYGFFSVIYKKNIKSILLTAFLITIYPYFYFQGVSIVYAVFIMTALYLVFEYLGMVKITETQVFKKDKNFLFIVIILFSIILMTAVPIGIRVSLFLSALIFLTQKKLATKQYIYLTMVMFIGFIYFGNIFNLIIGKVLYYLSRSVDAEGLHFYQVIQTVREAGSIPMTTVANRISGSSLGLLLSLLGYILLVIRHKPFIIALPLIGVGLFSYVGGLRFTVYAVPIAALSAVYLFYMVGKFFQNKQLQYTFVFLGTLGMLYPNITHVVGYKVPTVLNKAEVADLRELDKISSSTDYTIAWWDYGYPIWFYSDTNTLIDGARHSSDNFIISTILQTSSSELAANLSRVAIEAYVDSNYSGATSTLFPEGKSNRVNPNLLLEELENGTYPLPKKTRDIYFYLPYRMLNIFPTVSLFGNLDLTTGKKKRKMAFYPTNAVKNSKGIISFRNGIIFDTTKGSITLGKSKVNVKYFIATQNTQKGNVQLQSQLYHADGEYAIIYMKSYNRFVIMDTETFNSMYVQMFILEKYDHSLFDLVISSPYSKIYKLKI